MIIQYFSLIFYDVFMYLFKDLFHNIVLFLYSSVISNNKILVYLMVNNELLVIVIILLMYISLQLTIQNNDVKIKNKNKNDNVIKEVRKTNNVTKIKNIKSNKKDSIIYTKIPTIIEEETVVIPERIPERIQMHEIPEIPIEMPKRISPGIPINISTRGEEQIYRQIGILHNNDNSKILPLFGKATWRGSSKFLYYTQTDRFVSVNLPVYKNNKNCSLEYGCDELYDKDLVTVPQLNEEFIVTIYPVNSPRYIPYI